jgi:very-short-patch-repair endonuclease
MDLVGFLKRVGSAARTSTVRQAGFSDRAIRAAVAGGGVVRRRHGVLALQAAHEDIVAALSANGLLTCASGARHNGIWVLHEPRPLHLLCRHGNAKGFVIHRESVVEAQQIRPVASLTDTLLHSLRCLPDVEAALMVESALRQGRTNLDYLRERLPGNRNGAARKVLSLVDGSADSAIEVLARILFRQAGIRTETQVELSGIGNVDFLLEGRLIVELDGGSHLQPRQVKKDRRRNNAGTVNGYLVLRYDYSQIVYQRETVLAEVLQVLRRRSR